MMNIFINLVVSLFEGLAVTLAIYLITKKTMSLKEMSVLVLSITATFMILDLFAPQVAASARQGSGFGLGFTQIAGNAQTLPRRYFDPNSEDSRTLKQNEMVNSPTDTATATATPTATATATNESFSPILQAYANNPFDTQVTYASV